MMRDGVTLRESANAGDDEARRRGKQKSVLERTGPPTFDVCVEMIERDTWGVHTDVGAAVDALLAGQQAPKQARALCCSSTHFCSASGAGDQVVAAGQGALGTLALALALGRPLIGRGVHNPLDFVAFGHLNLKRYTEDEHGPCSQDDEHSWE